MLDSAGRPTVCKRQPASHDVSFYNLHWFMLTRIPAFHRRGFLFALYRYEIKISKIFLQNLIDILFRTVYLLFNERGFVMLLSRKFDYIEDMFSMASHLTGIFVDDLELSYESAGDLDLYPILDGRTGNPVVVTMWGDNRIKLYANDEEPSRLYFEELPDDQFRLV